MRHILPPLCVQNHNTESSKFLKNVFEVYFNSQNEKVFLLSKSITAIQNLNICNILCMKTNSRKKSHLNTAKQLGRRIQEENIKPVFP